MYQGFLRDLGRGSGGETCVNPAEAWSVTMQKEAGYGPKWCTPFKTFLYIYIIPTVYIYISCMNIYIYIYESYVIYPRISHHDSKACTVSWTFTMPKNEGFWLADLTRPQASEVVELQVEDEAPAKTGLFSHFQQEWRYMGMDQYLLIPFLGEWTSIYQLFWCSPGVQGFGTLPYI